MSDPQIHFISPTAQGITYTLSVLNDLGRMQEIYTGPKTSHRAVGLVAGQVMHSANLLTSAACLRCCNPNDVQPHVLNKFRDTFGPMKTQSIFSPFQRLNFAVKASNFYGQSDYGHPSDPIEVLEEVCAAERGPRDGLLGPTFSLVHTTQLSSYRRSPRGQLRARARIRCIVHTSWPGFASAVPIAPCTTGRDSPLKTWTRPWRPSL